MGQGHVLSAPNASTRCLAKSRMRQNLLRYRQWRKDRTHWLGEALSYVRPDDTLVVWCLDRLGRSLPHLITTMTDLEERGIGFKSLTENIDTTTSGGKLIFHIFGALAEFERNLTKERTQAGLTAARARGKKGGRPKVLTDRQISIANSLYTDRKASIQEICRTLKISRATLYRSIKAENGR
jgi:DNA invertase Pin-like site-specific DNA recombinase